MRGPMRQLLRRRQTRPGLLLRRRLVTFRRSSLFTTRSFRGAGCCLACGDRRTLFFELGGMRGVEILVNRRMAGLQIFGERLLRLRLFRFPRPATRGGFLTLTKWLHQKVTYPVPAAVAAN